MALLEESISLLRQDLVDIKNDFILCKIEIERLKVTIEDLRTSRANQVKIILACIAGGTSLAVGILEYFKH